jgi:pimeloyl-ACP methyl ester carboxylesterase
VRVVDDDNQPLGPNQPGELVLKGPSRSSGYWNNPEAYAAVLDADGWFHTGDIVRYDEEWYFYVVDRKKDMFISGGENVYPAEIEAVLYRHPAVHMCAVVGAPDPAMGRGGQGLCRPQAGRGGFAGSGGGVVNAEFTRLIAEGDRSSDNPQASPRVVMNSFYWKPPFVPAREEDLLSSLLTEKVGPEKYPGDFVASENWPNVAPGVYGQTNAISPKYVGDTVEKFIAAQPKPHILWVRGDSDQIVSDNSLFDFGTLGQLGFVPDWPGMDIYPPQPMVGQVRHVLEQYQAQGGDFEEVVIPETGHSPYIEKPEEFMTIFTKVLNDK